MSAQKSWLLFSLFLPQKPLLLFAKEEVLLQAVSPPCEASQPLARCVSYLGARHGSRKGERRLEKIQDQGCSSVRGVGGRAHAGMLFACSLGCLLLCLGSACCSQHGSRVLEIKLLLVCFPKWPLPMETAGGRELRCGF